MERRQMNFKGEGESMINRAGKDGTQCLTGLPSSKQERTAGHSLECAECAPALGSISNTRKGGGANVKGTGES